MNSEGGVAPLTSCGYGVGVADMTGHDQGRSGWKKTGPNRTTAQSGVSSSC